MCRPLLESGTGAAETAKVTGENNCQLQHADLKAENIQKDTMKARTILHCMLIYKRNEAKNLWSGERLFRANNGEQTQISRPNKPIVVHE
jgi:hypothetical protein